MSTPAASDASSESEAGSQPVATTAPTATPTSAPTAPPPPTATVAPTPTPTPSPVDQVEDSSDDGVVPPPGESWKRLKSRDDLSNEQLLEPDAVLPGAGNSLLVRFWGGAEPCFGARVQVTETDQVVEVLLVSGLAPGAASAVCIALAVAYEIEVPLSQPLGDREIAINQAAQPIPVPEVPDDAEFTTDQYLGLTQSEAEQLAAVEQRVLRTARIDDEYFGLTLDFDPSRVTIELEGGIVVAATGG